MYMKPKTLFFVAVCVSAVACNANPESDRHQGHGDHSMLPPPAAMLQPDPWAGTLQLAQIEDTNPDPQIVELSLTARPADVEYLPGKPAEAWTYDGTVPGPTIRANVGDTVVVRFTNELPESTTIHWHGMRVPSQMDGSLAMQDPVMPGESFEYRFVALDAGTFWYHPHVRSDRQVEKGMYGAIVVDDPLGPAIDAVADDVVVLDDVLVDPETGVPDPSTDDRAMMMGREGNLVLVNGRRSNLEIDVRAGEARRWRVVNAANSRFFRLAVEGGSMVRIGGDAGLLAQVEETTELLLVNGERADILVWANEPSSTAVLRALPHERATGAGDTEAVDIVRLVAKAQTPADTVLPTTLGTPAAPPTSQRNRSIRLGEEVGHHVTFTINGEAFPDVPHLRTTVGQTETWSIVNETEMDHPFHLHGFFFYSPAQKEWKDTINIPADSTVTLLPKFDDRDGAVGHWMYHCHILEHAEGGMMAEVEVE